MSEKDKNILGAFLLARHNEELTNEEIKDVQQAIKRVWNNFDKAIEYIEQHTDKLKTIRIPQIDFNYNDLLDILRGTNERTK